MHPRRFRAGLDEKQVVAAIAAAEAQTSAQIRVFVSHKRVQAPVAAAQGAFFHLGMDKTSGRNGVLIFLAPRSRKFAVIGDEQAHAKCGDGFWQELAGAMSGYFAQGKFTEGIVHGVQRAGELLARHFPRQPDGRNELPDRVAHD